jgi:hypothetical protein
MPRSLLVALAALAAVTAYAAGIGLKPGLWELRTVKQVVDGRDTSAQMAGLADKMQQAMASMPPEQRAQMESMLKQHGVGMSNGGNIRICISPEMARRDKPMIDKEGHCEPATVNHSGNQTTFEFSCTSNGVTSTGKGSSTVNADVISTHVDMTMREASGKTRAMQNDTEMKFVSADCGDIKPNDMPK